MHKNANPHARRRETPRPLVDGDRCCWPITQSPILHITDRVSAYRFLIDTGAEVSVVPPSPAECQQRCTDFSLVAVNGVTIHTYGKRSLTLNL